MEDDCVVILSDDESTYSSEIEQDDDEVLQNTDEEGDESSSSDDVEEVEQEEDDEEDGEEELMSSSDEEYENDNDNELIQLDVQNVELHLESDDSEYNEEQDEEVSLPLKDGHSATSKYIEENEGISLADELSYVQEDILENLENIQEAPASLQTDSRGGIKRTLVDRDGVDDGERVTKLAKISFQPVTIQDDSSECYKRVHELERERRNLTEQLMETKEELLYTEKALAETKDQLTTTKEKFDKTTEELKAQLLGCRLKNNTLFSEAEYYQTHSSVNETLISNTEQIIDDYKRQLRDVQCQVKEQQTKDLELLRAHRTISVLTRKLNALEEDSKIVSIMRGQLRNYDSVVCKNELLEQQNKALKQRVGNVELLKYQLQTERDKVIALEEKATELDRLRVEKELNSSDNESQSKPSVVVLKYKLLDVQQREILLTRNVGELETKLNIAKQEINSVRLKNSSLEKQLTAEKEENRIKADAIQRLERRLQFITKEREGCVNVLNSYKLDGGAELVLKEQLKELQSTLKRYDDKMTELEQKNEDVSKTINKTKKQLLLSNHEVITANERMEILQDQCQELQMEKQKFEEMLSKSPALH